MATDNQNSYHQPLFSSAVLNQKIELVQHLINNSDRIPLIKGPRGAGKSALLNILLNQTRGSWISCQIEASSTLQPNTLFNHLCSSFSVPQTDGDPLERLLAHLEALDQSGRLPVLLIDDAHLLPIPTFIALLRLFERRPSSLPLLKILLTADNKIEELLATPQSQVMNLQLLQQLDLPILNQEETEQFIHHIFGREEVPRQISLDSSQIERIFNESGGIPGKIEPLALALLGSEIQINTESERPGGIFSRISPAVIIGSILLITLLAATLFFQDQINQTLAEKSDNIESEERLPLPTLEFPPSETIQSVDLDATGSSKPEEELSGEARTPPEPILPEVAFTSEPVVEANTPEPDIITNPALSTEAVATPLLAGTEISQPELTTEETTVATGEDENKEAEATASTLPLRKADDIQQSPAPPAPKSGKPTPETKPAPARTEVHAPPKLAREAWINRQKPTAYTLQLIGVGNEAAVKKYMQQHPLPGQFALFHSPRNGKSWYSLLYGVYSDRDAAVAAREKLPGNLKSNDIWPRSFSSVQKAIQGK
ncbi:MAG: AAA family ATPase [Gammaproteobacteria bacterium]|nr:AAA family ATPase [Gammaproteobacteria bacterium]